ncbi:cysteine desulfurase [Lachnospiraceae bacterium YSD2013]|nr:cysteine desulfurase [Lachnospiraceae bacterium YSD2013]
MKWPDCFVIMINMKKTIYADNAATTKLCDEAYEAMQPYFKEIYANPSQSYAAGSLAKRGLNDARRVIAESLSAFDKEIVFTSGGSEADNLALIGVMDACRDKGRHLITTDIEHKAVLETAKYLERNGVRVTYVHVGADGRVNPEDIERAICGDTVLISVMTANNETGTLQPIEEIGKIAKAHGVLFHTDAVQAYGKIELSPEKMNIDLLSASAHKFNGPRGAGFLYVKRGTPISSFIHGGSQEYGLRAGTENVPGIVGMAVAATISLEKMAERAEYEAMLTKRLHDGVLKRLEGVSVNGSMDYRLPGVINFSFAGVEGESLLISLDMKGICVSTGSACVMSTDTPSHVITAITGDEERARQSIRFSLGHENTVEEVDYIIDALGESVEYLRRLRE